MGSPEPFALDCSTNSDICSVVQISCCGMVPKRNVQPVDLDHCSSHCDEAVAPLESLRGRLSGREAQIETAELFRLLGDPTRLSILHALLEAGELCVCDLARLAGVAENVVSQALRLLRAADVVRARRDGRRIHYRLADAHVRMLLDLSADHVRHQAAVGHDGEPTAAQVTRVSAGRRVS